ncbi:MAG: GNAT family N-acetyltransferase [Clostridia bacterium]|nr:GNAT family N-acetyltransferase [Clostridia bacterium]
MFKRIPDLSTERLLLRKIRLNDAPDMFEYSKDPEVTKYLLWDPHPNVEHTRNYIDYLQDRYRDGKYYDWAVILKSSGKMIGTCGFSSILPEHRSAEVGYVLNPAFRGQGIAGEALSAVLDFAFRKMALNRVEAKCVAENASSERVMQKVGMTFEGVARSALLVKGEFRNIKIYSMLRSEYVRFKQKS